MFLLLLACTETTTTTLPTCSVELVTATPESALPGDEVVLAASPVTVDYDTALSLAGARAEIVSVDRTGCDSCDTCLTDAECGTCATDCDACDALCDATCVETITFIVPDVESGVTTIELFNTHGGSNRLSFEVLGTSDSGDTGTDSGE
ncbi:MAG: hypothetical protein GY913_26200 [Proteobacteria bacterium]|nr:hypothetical protein [Pseudomonadota bacterium]MCP4920409.1 hypothetical protein [Pseudomonadota bacterium]